jgi:hypothetical protein
VIEYVLTIGSFDSAWVSTPGEDTLTYYCREVVDLIAEADDYYEFVELTDDTVHIR